ncbi:CPBP family intramembrane metalloprotease [Staphylococcus devriesei]|uniref:CPBP family lipoprotein N-acylation protein LnsB n=1 Tax=Staphylococcus devriesei TaxID=586733 RepID=UPI000E68A405|nr:CPBP family lipoprotein N-acylation protein LnsB [Staphylococcus devriesei]RIL72494.1 CPBP family intramembrane metalloprotease [Staphylococcus devriesei]
MNKEVVARVVPRNRWGTDDIVKKDFLLLPIYIFFQILMPIIIVFGVLGVTAMITQDPPPLYLYNLTLSMSFVIAQFIAIGAFFVLHKFYIANVARRQLYYVKQQYMGVIACVIVISLILYFGFNALAQVMPSPLGYEKTQALIRLEGLFNHPIAIIFTFMSMVILRPLVEELILRHLIIHELGKKWNLAFVIILSLFIEVILHVYDFISIMEIIPYMILSIGAIFVYLYSGKNLAASYLYHSSVQLVIFIITMIERFF